MAMSGSKSSQGGAFSNRRLRRRATPPVDEFLEVKAEWLNDGSLLDRVGMHCIEVFMREPDDSFTRWVGPGKLTVSSMCSGCEFPLLTSASLTRAMAMHHAEELLQLEVQDSCEIDPKKQRFIKRLHYLDMDPDDHAPLVGGPCLFCRGKGGSLTLGGPVCLPLVPPSPEGAWVSPHQTW